jgi:plastocyanin
MLLRFTSSLLLAAAIATPAVAAPPDGRNWPGEEMPLPLAVRTPADLSVKALAERQYLIFNLLAGGKLAFDSGDYATAASKWEALLRLNGLDPDIERVIRPLAQDARSRAGGRASGGEPSVPATPPGGSPQPSTPDVPAAPARGAASVVNVSGTVSGGGTLGPGGTVIWLRRVGGDTPKPAPARGKTITQRGKTFVPHVLAVTVGTKVSFRNDDPIFHNIFSLSKPNEFDTGLYKQGGSYTQVFKRAGMVQLLCNIHSSMLGFVYVVDTPWYTQAEGSGAFSIKGVPPGEYEVNIWHESASKTQTERVTVGADGLRGLALRVSGDRRTPQFLPDKSGKPRQAHLGY